MQAGRIDAEARRDAGPEVARDHISGLDNGPGDPQRRRVLQIQGNRSLAAIRRGEVPECRASGGVAREWLDLDDVSSQVREHARGEWPGNKRPEVDDTHAVEGTR